MKKIYILDTNILINSPSAIFAFDEHDICIVDVVLDELDRKKNENGTVGFNAREAIRALSALQECGSLVAGVSLPGGGTVKVIARAPYNPNVNPTNDDIILNTIKQYEWPEGANVILVTNDLNMRLKAEVRGVKAEPYRSETSASLHKQYKGRCTAVVSSAAIDTFYEVKQLSTADVISVDGKTDYQFTVNEFVLLVDECNIKHSALARYDGKCLVPLRYDRCAPQGVHPRNIGQKFAQEALMEAIEEAPLVILRGPAGTAKTFYSLAVGLEKTLGKDPMFDKILVTRANVKMDEDIGYLKGTEMDKIGPLIRPVFDNLEQLTKTEGRKDGNDETSYVQHLFERGIIEAQAMAYMRGRSVPNTWILVDECQNTTPSQVFSLITRCGVGSKIIMVGDPEQIDAPHLDARNNGLTYASERMKGSPLCWQITFTDEECVRSPLALEAIQRMPPKGTYKAPTRTD